MNIVTLLKENPVVIATAAIVLSVLGASMNVTLPADEKIEEIKIELAQEWNEREQYRSQQRTYHNRRELQDVEFRMRYIQNEINRINQIPTYLNRSITPEEAWQIQQYKDEWGLLQQRHQELLHD